jgi:Coenzyme PQQ synthesis protein D (PqqD)
MKELGPDQQRHRELADSGEPDNPRKIDGLDITASEDGCIVSSPGSDRIHFLNPTAVLVLEFCNGENRPEEIVDLVQKAYHLLEPPFEDVQAVLEQLKVEGLLV